MDRTQMQVPELVLCSDFINTNKAQKKEPGEVKVKSRKCSQEKKTTNPTGKNETQQGGLKHQTLD